MNSHRQKQAMRNLAAAGGCICLERWPGHRLMETCPPSFISANMRAHRSHSQPDWCRTRVYKSEYTQRQHYKILSSGIIKLSNLRLCEYVNSVFNLNMGWDGCVPCPYVPVVLLWLAWTGFLQVPEAAAAAGPILAGGGAAVGISRIRHTLISSGISGDAGYSSIIIRWGHGDSRGN